MPGAAGWLERYLEAIQAERDAARNTLLSYHRDLTDFAAFLAGARPRLRRRRAAPTSRPIWSTRPTAAWRRRRGRGGCRAIRQLYRFAFLEGWRTDDPAALIKGPKRERTLPGSLSEAEVDRLLAAAETLGRTAGRPAARHLPDAGALRHRAPGQRARVAAAGRGARRPADDPDPRQGRPRADGAAVAAGAGGDRRLAGAARRRRDRPRRGGSARRTCSRRAASAGT